MFNSRFDLQKLDYSATYDNSLDYSPTFRAYSEQLANRLRREHALQGKRVIEVGSGQGRFLELLCAGVAAEGVGYDPSYDGHHSQADNVRFVQDYYSDRYASEPVDLVVCRHVLEHLPEPLAFLRGLHRALAAQGDTALYFEVPNAFQVFAGTSMWDVIYPHVHYFTAESLSALFQAAGFQLSGLGTAFNSQYLWIEARTGVPRPPPDRAPHGDLGAITAGFNQRFQDAVQQWGAFIAHALGEGKRIAFWGAGAKGVTFLNVVPQARDLGAIVDLNPRKQGMYIPGMGREVLSPEDLLADPPQTIITLNPAYVGEIQAMLREFGMDAEVVSSPLPAG